MDGINVIGTFRGLKKCMGDSTSITHHGANKEILMVTFCNKSNSTNDEDYYTSYQDDTATTNANSDKVYEICLKRLFRNFHNVEISVGGDNITMTAMKSAMGLGAIYTGYAEKEYQADFGCAEVTPRRPYMIDLTDNIGEYKLVFSPGSLPYVFVSDEEDVGGFLSNLFDRKKTVFALLLSLLILYCTSLFLYNGVKPPQNVSEFITSFYHSDPAWYNPWFFSSEQTVKHDEFDEFITAQ